MFRKMMSSAVAFVAIVACAACNSTLGPQSTTEASDRDRGPRESSDYDKVCVVELRAVEITGPAESRAVYGGDYVVITWANHHICGGYDSIVEISYDGGHSFQLLGKKRNGVSMGWRVPELDGVRPVIRVQTEDQLGMVSDDLALALPIASRNGGGDRTPQERD